MRKYNLRNVKYMHYLDYKLNNTPKYMEEYDGNRFPRLVQFLYKQRHKDDKHAVNVNEVEIKMKHIFRILWREGLFRSCQA